MAEGRKGERIDEICTCGHLKAVHRGLQGHGACSICSCGYFTWKAMLYKEVLALHNGDNVLAELKRTLKLKGIEEDVNLWGVIVLAIQEFSVSVEVLYE